MVLAADNSSIKQSSLAEAISDIKHFESINNNIIEQSPYLPIDPNNWIRNDIIHRQAFSLPTETIAVKSKKILAPYFELYDIYANFSQFSFITPAENLLLDSSIILGSQRCLAGPCINSEDEFYSRWRSVSHGLFDDIDMSNFFIAGGSVLACLLPSTTTNSFDASDIDVFVYGITPEEARIRIVEGNKGGCCNQIYFHSIIIFSFICISFLYSAFFDFRAPQFACTRIRPTSRVYSAVCDYSIITCCHTRWLRAVSTDSVRSSHLSLSGGNSFGIRH
jgi:hypothetical protein